MIQTIKKSIIRDNNFMNFMENYRIKDNCDKKITHTSWGKVMGKYHIPDEDMDLFLVCIIRILLKKISLAVRI